MTQVPRSRQDLQQETRDTLVTAARVVFSETGYHAATLEAIARRAGYSKGAVYSNFSGKADLFLAVMDANMQDAGTHEGGWDLPEPEADDGPDCEALPEQFDETIQGMGLATLEFIAAAARDPELRPEMTKRMAAVTDHYAATAARADHDEADPLSSAERGALLAALDQGTALLTLGGSALIDQRALRTGMQRLLVPGPSEKPREGAPGAPALHDARVRQRLAASARADGWEETLVE
ncbi:TetR/AcrR family transcriptional regulator [Ornithinimicrobium sp. F0845]|uniref:TetR/AcrR family transcriptional regulator n=1 Tax=Ornithinimicrobium sp. F0845 TaxID=2926412 RepID=UPI001FF20B20|nr:TetR/AcrR family transcriptional regulator [Ornithinimicrobium sp. F0845]MCK0112151.1 TetR/AcrR family transcriptional regulator [Ornithinimicrobium sp. F0845]